MSADFEDGKDDGALRTIGEVSKALGIKTHVLRYWEQQFPMLQPLKRSGGRRYYRSEDVDLVETINRLVNQQGYTLKGARKAIKDGASHDISAPEATGADHIEEAIAVNDTPNAASAPQAFLSGDATPIADDGGIGDFFGNAADDHGNDQLEPPSSAGGEPLSPAVDTDTTAIPRTEILNRLRQMRSELADALAA